MIDKIRQLLHRKDQYIYNYNYEIDKFDSASFGLIINYKKSGKRTIERIVNISIYVLIGILIFSTRPFNFFGLSPVITLIALMVIVVLFIFIGRLIFQPLTMTILNELVRQKKLNIISEEKFNDYLDKINSAIENSTGSDEHKKEAIEYNNNLR
jgi:ABC-type multidrug transport system fused ATPase/permease subunit